uniref:Phosphatidylinositol 3-kinase age-1 n=1 Tax=Caenorhabditis remanei TaxID=31234 RepID=I6NER7_CAERE|nr:AGE-1 [Caenorhabditis remanei]AET63280.1 AGE-1 [Caenorhabditis remanei]AIT15685.1 AGE-1 [Caenorhabditis remanei]AIT15687.1 AGE-1 [Caenorhabditis remanei]
MSLGRSSSTTFRNRTGSNSSRDLPATRKNSTRVSQAHANILHPQLQAMLEQWQMRERPSLETENGKGSLLLKTGVADLINLCPFGEVITVAFPWFLANVRINLDMKLYELKYQLFQRIGPMKWAPFTTRAQDYRFQQLNGFGEIEEIFNEEQQISSLEIHGTFPILFLFQPEGANADFQLMAHISECLEYSLEKLEGSLDEELRQFRASLWARTKETCLTRGQEGTNHYAFPEEQYLCVGEECPRDLDSKARSANLTYQVYWRWRQEELNESCERTMKISIPFDCNYTPYTLLKRCLKEFVRLNVYDAEDMDDEGWILQLAGRHTYVTNADVKLTSYDRIRSELESYRSPAFIICRESIVMKNYARPKPLYEPHYVRVHERKLALDVLSVSINNPATDAEPRAKNEDKVLTDFRPTASLQHISLWDLDANLMIRPISITGFNYPKEKEKDDKTYARIEFSVYVGTLVLASKSTSKTNAKFGTWKNEMYTFDLYMKDMPPSALLSIRVFSGELCKNNEKEFGWVNIPLTDWHDELRQGQFEFGMWAPEPSSDRSRIGENGGRIGCNVSVKFEISSYGGRVRMPSHGQYTYLVEHRSTWTEAADIMGDDYEACISDPGYKVLQQLVKKHDDGIVLNEEEQQHVWTWRRYIQKQEPDLLTVLSELKIVWTDREKFSELYVMLETWRPPSVAAALTLLGKRCTDRVIRKFAVEKLNEQLSPVTFHLFLLPLVQALKYEPRAQSEVGVMLLTRALSDYRIGHRLFWLLRAEIVRLGGGDSTSEECRRISLLMEAYLRGNGEHINVILRQVQMVNSLTKISAIVKGLSKEAATQRLRYELRSISHNLENIDSPLDPAYKLGKIIIDKAIVLGSAKQPLRLVWKNNNPLSEQHLEFCSMIFKNGDDLRQDMLVLQVLEVMDNIWKAANIDCCLNPYGVLPMGESIGIIEVVPNCQTIFEIQVGNGFMNTAVRSIEASFLNKWIRKKCGLEDDKKKKKKKDASKNESVQKIDNAQATKKYFESVDRFLYSCVGYSVATYIMGIKDRHSDNLMVTEDGKYFHIDFGHILGHGKTKLGIQRDRQPFILTEHFLTVIRSGKPVDGNSHELQKFKTLCIEAYEVMWNNRELFVSLFTLMLGMELPELSTKEDLDHLKKTLFCKGENKEQARKFFAGIYEEAFNGSWSTKTNWLFHAVKHY